MQTLIWFISTFVDMLLEMIGNIYDMLRCYWKHYGAQEALAHLLICMAAGLSLATENPYMLLVAAVLFFSLMIHIVETAS